MQKGRLLNFEIYNNCRQHLKHVMAKASRLFWMAGIVVTVFHSTAKAACPAAPVGSNQDRVIQMVAGGDGFVQMGSDAEVDATEEGAIVYDAVNNTLAVCDGTNWVALGAGGGGSGGFIPACKADMSNVAIGDTCDDGSKFLGTHPNYGWQGFYVTDIDQRSFSNWYNSITLCNNLNRHGHSDWYLPSRAELNLLFENQDTIGSSSPGVGLYWSSTELVHGNAWYQNFGNGDQNYDSKNSFNGVRCVRRD